MKLTKILLVVAVALAVCLPQQAFGVALSGGFKTAKIADWSSLYRPPSGRPGQIQDPVPAAGVFVPTLPGDDNRTIFNVSTVPDIPPFEFVSGMPDQLKGMMYDLTPYGAVTDPAGQTTIYFGGLYRNPLVQNLADARLGGVLEIWEDPGTQALFNPHSTNALGTGPFAWDEADSLGNVPGPENHVIPGAAGTVGPDTFPTVNEEGEGLWLQFVLIPFPGAGIDPTIPGGTVLSETVKIGGSESGSGEAYAMVVGGSFAGNIQGFLGGPGGLDANYANSGYAVPAGLRADLHILFDVDPDPPNAAVELGLWAIKSQDPTTFVVVPEPMTMAGLMLGIGSLVTYIKKRR